MTATTPIWGKLADLFSKKLLVQSALVIFSAGSLDRRARPQHGGPDRRPRPPGARRRRPDRTGPGRDRVDGQPPRTRPVRRLHRRHLRTRDRERPAHRRADRRRARTRLALVLLPRPPGRGAGVRGPAEDPAPAGPPTRGPCRLPGRHPARRRRLDPAGLGLPGRQPVRLGLGHQRGPRGGRTARGRSGDLRRGPGRDRTGDPAPALPRSHDQPGDDGLGADRSRDVRVRRST